MGSYLRTIALWALLALALAALPAQAGQTASLVIKVVVPPQAATIQALGATTPAPNLYAAVTAAPVADLSGLAGGRYSATLVSASAAAFGAPRFTAPGSAGIPYSLSLDGRPVRFDQGRAELAPGGSGRLAITTPSAVPAPLGDSLLLVMQAN